MQVDDADRKILRHMQGDPSATTAELAARAGLTVGTCWRRIEKLTTTGVIQGQEAIIAWDALGFSVEVSLRITLDKTNPRAFDEFITAARAVPEVLEIQTFLGRVDVRLNIIARDMAHYQDIYRHQILPLPHINEIEALMHISTIKRDEALPL
ncbi:MAG: Lrp/AsnC family transcriptional regulator [Halocynthiibacter sp.]